jgi:hypothetical protein
MFFANLQLVYLLIIIQLNLQKIKKDSFRNDISSQDWNSISELNDIDLNSMWHIWRNIFLNVADKHAPIRTKRVGSFKSPWITFHLKQCMHRRDVLKI